MRPREAIELETAVRGRAEVVAGCVALLRGGTCDARLLRALRSGRDLPPPADPAWLRVWGARGLLWVWDDAALPALLGALRDDAWRVREGAARAVARHRLDGALEAVAALQDDEVPRVRAAAQRALARLVSG